jgi:hypothetical protein
MTFAPPIFMKLRIPQYRSVETFCVKPHQTENVQNWAKINLHPYIKFCLHCPNSMKLQAVILYRISPKSVTKFGNFWYKFCYVHMQSMAVAQPSFKKHKLSYRAAVRIPLSNFMKIWQTCCFLTLCHRQQTSEQPQ